MPEAHHQINQSTTHIDAMGRFSVDAEEHDLQIKTDFFGQNASEQAFKVSITNSGNKEEVTLTTVQPSHRLFSVA